jgi:hypothetical protein
MGWRLPAALLFAVLSTNAIAAPIFQATFQGTVSELLSDDFEIFAGVQAGDPFFVSISYDLAGAIDSDPNVNRGEFRNLTSTFSIAVGALTLQSSDVLGFSPIHPRVIVEDFATGDSWAYQAIGQRDAARFFDLTLILTGTSDLLSTASLPASLSDLNLAAVTGHSATRLVVNAGSGLQQSTLRFDFSSASENEPIAVAEPTTGLLMVLGLMITAIFRRRLPSSLHHM